MKTPTVFTKSGAKSTSTVSLDKAVFGEVPKKHDLLKQAYVAYLASSRKSSATTKKRGEVRGGGKKPWRQKGTGRARAGSIRSPIWRGGGITFGPTGDENYAKKMHKTAKRKAVRQALSIALDEKSVSVIEAIQLKEGKTKEFTALQDKMNLSGSVLVVVADKSDTLMRATNNLQGINCVQAHYLNVFDILNADSVLIEKPALEIINTWLGATS